MIGQIDAVARLLQDGDPETVRLVKNQLVEGGAENLRDLETLSHTNDNCVCRHAREMIRELRQREVESEFDLCCRMFFDGCDIEVILWQLAATLGSLEDACDGRRIVDQWGRRFAIRIGGAVSSRERVLALSDFMVRDLCFRGNSDDYYNPANSILPEVMKARTGIPISLVMLWKMVAVRTGMIVDGLNLPGHFIARHEDVIFDPFHKGRILSRGDCEDILARQGLTLQLCHLAPATPRQILLRVLANLRYAYDLRGDCCHHARIENWMLALCEA